MSSKGNIVIGGICLAFGVSMSLLPYYFRTRTESLSTKQSLTGSQRQRGMYMNVGSQDAGIDPDWDVDNKRWKGFDKRNPSESK
mmetsp:Transcript_10166/g.9107  ORF Transcript_10166/g.9107 Transcript_10166/m.9107 type:complete len:84 (-) Transcript_10166:99-350(-)